jgi:hypothetical protein
MCDPRNEESKPRPAGGEQQERLDGALEELPNWQARKLLLLVIGAVLPRDAFVRQAIDRGGTSSAESLHLAQASLEETSFTFVARAQGRARNWLQHPLTSPTAAMDPLEWRA